MNSTAEKVNVEIYETGGREAFITGITSQKSGGLTAEWVTRSSFSSDHLL
jgi:hypothetical protein